MSVTIVLPTYNERENIVEVLDRIKKAGENFKVVVIDDASPDGTADLAAAYASSRSGIEVVRRNSKDGLGSAYRFAFSRLFSLTAGQENDVIVTMDSDLSHDPSVIPKLVEGIASGADVVVGSRYVSGGGTADWPLHRRILSRWGNRYTSWILGVDVRDCTSGFRAYRASSLQRIQPETTTAEGYAFLTEMIVRASDAGLQIEEFPIRFIDRTSGSSKMSARIVLESMTLVTRWGAERCVAKLLSRWRRSVG